MENNESKVKEKIELICFNITTQVKSLIQEKNDELESSVDKSFNISFFPSSTTKEKHLVRIDCSIRMMTFFEKYVIILREIVFSNVNSEQCKIEYTIPRTELKRRKPVNSDIVRLHRAIGDRFLDIRTSFGEDAELVKDFIVYISEKFKTNLFGYYQFSLSDFIKKSGNNGSDLRRIHPKFATSSKGGENAPQIEGYKFETVFEYTLYKLMTQKLIFSKAVTYNERTADETKEITIETLDIIKKGKIIQKKKGLKTIFEIQLSEEMLNGFLRRYFTLNSKEYFELGRARDGEGRKSLYMFLVNAFQVEASKGKNSKLLNGLNYMENSVSYLAKVTNIQAETINKKSGQKEKVEPKEIKKRLTQVFKTTKAILNKNKGLDYSWEFFAREEHNEKYWVRLYFNKPIEFEKLKELKDEGLFYSLLHQNLNEIYTQNKLKYITKLSRSFTDKDDIFQIWLNDKGANKEEKIKALDTAWLTAFKIRLDRGNLENIFYNGFEISLP